MNTVRSAAVGASSMPMTATRSQSTDTFAGKLRAIWMMLTFVFSLVPIVAGLDKFTNILTNWESYLNPMVAHALPFSPRVFMEVVGVIEIVAGIIVFYRPRVGAVIVAAWLGCNAMSLLVSGHYLDVAVRDLVMAASALALAKLTPIVKSDKR